MSKVFSIIFIFISFFSNLYPQQSGIVKYETFFNGELQKDIPEFVMSYNNNICEITNINGKSTEKIYFDYLNKKTYQTFIHKEGTIYTASENFENYPKPELKEGTETISGYKCKIAHVVIRSNQIDVYYTDEAGIKGSPVINLGHELGLILKIVRNGNYEIKASDISLKDVDVKLPSDFGAVVDLPTYKEKITENNFTTVQIFLHEKINFGDTIVNPADNISNVTYRFSNGTVILKKVTLPKKIKGNLLFAELSEMSNGDAYDRTGSVFLIPDAEVTMMNALKGGLDKIPFIKDSKGNEYQGMVADKNYLPSIELIRFITPFGVNKYNDQIKVNGIKWEDSVIYKQDLTDLMQFLTGEVWIGVFIGNYDKGGHIVSLKLKYHPDEPSLPDEPLDKKYWMMPVINTVNIMEMSGQNYGRIFEFDTLKVKINIPEGLKNLKIRYISTGHGGWGNGDEFNQKMNELFIDNQRVYEYIPWRTDCGSYRKYNPSSGNFPNGVSSSDYSRSGWCPGSTSIPVDIPIEMKSGQHIIKIFIPQGKPEGNSFSAWNVSLCLIGEY
jgi:GLPGLI family protein